MASEDPRLARLTELCLGLPDAERDEPMPHAGFRVRNRTFAYFLDDHHGDGIVGVCAKAGPGENERLIAEAGDRYYRADYLAARGWVSLRLDTAEVDWDEVADLVTGSYVLVAPKTLGRQVTGAGRA